MQGFICGLESDDIILYSQRGYQDVERTDTTVEQSSLLIEDHLILSLELQK